MTEICQKLASYNNGWFNGNIIWIILALFCMLLAIIKIGSFIFSVNRSAEKVNRELMKVAMLIIVGMIPSSIGSNNINNYNSKLINEISSKSVLVQVKSQNNTFFFENVEHKNNKVTGKPVLKIAHKTGFLGIKENEISVGGNSVTITGNAQITKVNARKAIKEHLTDSF